MLIGVLIKSVAPIFEDKFQTNSELDM